MSDVMRDETEPNEQEFPCQVCGAPDADWDETETELRCPDHHSPTNYPKF